MIEHKDPHVREVGCTIAEALAKLEHVVGANYMLSLVARCTDKDLDADIIITKDALEQIITTVVKRAEVQFDPRQIAHTERWPCEKDDCNSPVSLEHQSPHGGKSKWLCTTCGLLAKLTGWIPTFAAEQLKNLVHAIGTGGWRVKFDGRWYDISIRDRGSAVRIPVNQLWHVKGHDCGPGQGDDHE